MALFLRLRPGAAAALCLLLPATGCCYLLLQPHAPSLPPLRSVNCASRMESTGFPGTIQVSEETHRCALEQMRRRAVSAAQSANSRHASEPWETQKSWGNAQSMPSTANASNSSNAALSRAAPQLGDSGAVSGSACGAEGGASSGAPEFEFAPLGQRIIKGKGLLSTYLLKVGSSARGVAWAPGPQEHAWVAMVARCSLLTGLRGARHLHHCASCRHAPLQEGDWASALEQYQSMQHAMWSPTPEGIRAHTAGFEEGWRMCLSAAAPGTDAAPPAAGAMT